MKKQIVPIILLSLTCLTANAAKLNLTLGKDIKSHDDSLAISYNVYYAIAPDAVDTDSNEMKNLSLSKMSEWLSTLNKALADKHPINSVDGKPSQVTLGYMKNGAMVYPDSCKNIPLSDSTNITLIETGCTVKQ